MKRLNDEGTTCRVSYRNGDKTVGPKKGGIVQLKDRPRKGGKLIERLSGDHFISSPRSFLIRQIAL